MSKDKPVIIEIPVRIPSLAIVVIVALVVSLISLVLLQQLTLPQVDTQDGAIDFVPAAQEFIPGEAMTIHANTVTVYVPPKAIDITGSVVITPREPDVFPSAGEPEWTRPQVVDVEFRDAEGTPMPNIIFSMPIQICFQLDKEQWDDFSQYPGRYEVQYYAAEKNPPSWQLLPMATNPDLFLLCGKTYHLSLFALAVRLDTGIPVTGPTPTIIPTIVFPTATLTGVPANRDRDPAIDNTNTPVPTVVPTDRPTNAPAPTVVPTDQPTNAPAPTVVPTDQPTNAPAPTHMPKPTKTPRPTRMPGGPSTPTSAPQPTPTDPPAPTDTQPAPTDPPAVTPTP